MTDLKFQNYRINCCYDPWKAIKGRERKHYERL